MPVSGGFFTTTEENFTTMTDTEKALLQAQHRLDEAQARNRVKERKARTRRLIQTGAILEKVLPEIRTMEPQTLEEYLLRRILRKGTLAGPAPIGGSPGTEPSERAKGTDTQAHSDRGNSGKGAAGNTDDGAADIGGIPITKNTQKGIKRSEGLRATGGRFLFPKGALTHHLPEAGGGIPPVGRARALSEGDAAPAGAYGQCRTSAEVSSLSTQGAAVSCRKQLLPCLRKPATGSFVAEMDGAPAPSIFSFAKEKQKRKRGETFWQSTI